MSDIKWRDGYVCYADGVMWKTSPHSPDGLFWEPDTGHSLKCRQVGCEAILKYDDFQLNEICEGDFIKVSELDTEQKHNNVVDVFELFGIKATTKKCGTWQVRKITYPQLMAIGKLKRAMIERDSGPICGKPNADFVKSIDKVTALEEDPVAQRFSALKTAIENGDYEDITNITFQIMKSGTITGDHLNCGSKDSKAFKLLESLNYDYDEDKRQWYQKVYV